MSDESPRARSLALLKRLAEAHGASGNEDAIRTIFREELEHDINTDRLGNIFCVKAGLASSPRIMLAAHMDEVGLTVQSITRHGLLKFTALGGWWPHTLLAQRVRILTREGHEVMGVIGAKPPHFLTPAESEKVLKIDEMFIDVGAGSREEALNDLGIRLGDPIVPFSPFTPLSRPDYYMCKALDDRVGVALVIEVIQSLKKLSHPNTVVAVGTVQEEVGVRGAQTAPHGAQSDAAIVLEGTPADDLPGLPEDEQQGVPGGGVQIRILDPSTLMNRKLIELSVALAEQYQIPYQLAVRKSGSTDARAIHLFGSGIPTVVLGVPVRYIHTHNGIFNFQDYCSALDLTLRLMAAMDQTTVAGFTAF